MGKSSRAKRLKRHETQKVKFKKKKCGRKLPKGTNVTNLAFETRKIVVPGCTPAPSKECDREEEKKRRIVVYLSMLWNFNTKVRIEALEALLGYAKSVPEEVLPSLGSLLERAGPLLCNEEAKIRHLAAELLRAVTQKFPVEKLVPFASLMVGYISVALTHLTRAVRQDTLRLLDSLLTIPAASSLFVTDAVKLLRDLLTLLSPSGKGTRLESSTLEADETNLVWYRTVLQPILRILQSITSQQKTETFLAEKKSVTFVLGESLFVDLTSAKSRSLLERETAILSAKRGDPGQKDSKQDISLVRDLSSVLDVIWTEAMNSLTSDTAKYKADAGVLVTLVVEVCVALSSPVGLLSDLPSKDQELLLSTCVCPLLSHIGQSFPLPEECFSSVFSQSKAKQKQKPTANNTAVRFNFGFCHLYAQLSAHAPRDVSAQVLRFIQESLTPPIDIRQQDIPLIMDILKCLRPAIQNESTLVKSVANASLNPDLPMQEMRMLLIEFLTESYLMNPISLRSSSCSWIKKVPSELVPLLGNASKLQERALRCLSQLAATNCGDFMGSLRKEWKGPPSSGSEALDVKCLTYWIKTTA